MGAMAACFLLKEVPHNESLDCILTALLMLITSPQNGFEHPTCRWLVRLSKDNKAGTTQTLETVLQQFLKAEHGIQRASILIPVFGEDVQKTHWR